MQSAMKLFSPEWCDAAIGAANASTTMRKGFKDPETFTYKMEFSCLDADLACHVEWDKGKVIAWTPPKFEESELWLVIKADVATWRLAAEGSSEGGTLLMGGKIKFAKGPMSAAIENGGAFNSFLRSWGEVPTDWDA